MGVTREKKSDRPMIVRPGKTKAEAYLRASEIAKLVEDKYGLNVWQQDRIAKVVATNEAIRQEWIDVDVEAKGEAYWDRRALRDKTIRAYTQGRSWNRGAAVAGTKFHAVADKSDTSDAFVADEDFADDLAVYQKVIAAVGKVIATERFVVNDELGIGGTFDKLIACDLLTPDGLPAGNVIADLKTGKVEKKELEFGMQMAVYANSVYYDNGVRTTYDVNKNWAMVIHLSLGTNRAEIIWVDIASAFEVVKAAILIKETRKIKTVVAMEVEGPTLEEKILSAPNTNILMQIWRMNKDSWNDDLSALVEKRGRQIGEGN